MNIAFYTFNECCPTIGGTERTTSLVADCLNKYFGYTSYSIYTQSVSTEDQRHQFTGYFKFTQDDESKSRLVSFIKNNNISVVINQGGFKFGILLSDLIKRERLDCVQIFALHFSPGSFEENHISFAERIKILRNRRLPIELAKVLFYPLYYWIMHNLAQKQYRLIERKANKIVLLSNRFKDEWSQYAHGKIKSQSLECLAAIPNGLTFGNFANYLDIVDKEKRVLIVGRLDEAQKKISIALKMWQHIATKPEFDGWELDIVGDGPDKGLYASIVEQNEIPRVTFHGRKNPESYYKKSAIFLMTSAYEGWGMTLVEASQFGVVPFVFNTFSSLSDIIKDGENGFIFKAYDIESYEKGLEKMMLNDDERFKVAKNAVENARRFSMNNIAGMWHSLISELTV